ncbi:hypothetical protein MHB44_08815 [Lysinibacillus sp. FSL H8-0500]|uniref:hypothetical protein n=1 Tax=Lysinibacillus sp. FSL H8-0500 TaxID=2921393 RepID=UPI0031019C0B
MYNKQVLTGKVDDMFEDLKKQSYEIIAVHSNFSDASKIIVDTVSSEVVMRSKTLITDMYAQMSKNTMSSNIFDDAERRSQFYEANIRRDILSKYQFDIATINAFQSGIQYKELHCLYSSLAVVAGTTAIGGVLKYALATTVKVPIVAIIAGAVVAFCITYLKIIPNKNKANFRKATEDFLYELKKEFIKWFDEIEVYYNDRIQGLVSTFKEGGRI